MWPYLPGRRHRTCPRASGHHGRRPGRRTWRGEADLRSCTYGLPSLTTSLCAQAIGVPRYTSLRNRPISRFIGAVMGQARTRVRHERILDAALEVFSARGYRDASVDDV